jgi:hypothetical protein
VRRYGIKLLQQQTDEAHQFKATAERIEQQLIAQNRLLSQLCLHHPNLTGLAKLSAGCASRPNRKLVFDTHFSHAPRSVPRT